MAPSFHRSYNGRPNGEVTIILQKRMQREQKRAPRVMLKKVGGSLPQHLIMEILSWLPVKSLVKFSVVCKSWYSIISDPYFISKHMQNYYKNSNEYGGCLIAQFVVTQPSELEVYEFLVDDKTQRVLASEEIETLDIHNYYLCGPCHGLYYLWQWSFGNRRIVWNPALDELKVLPPIMSNPNHPPHIILERFDPESYGFGYDPHTRDYKVIITKAYNDTTLESSGLDCRLAVFIYSLKDDSWRYWGDMSKYYFLQRNKCYIFVNNTVYWLGSTDSESFFGKDFEVIIAFNLATETYQELKMPGGYEKPALTCPALAVCHGSIALILSYEEKSRFVMWCYNEEEQWAKKCIINLEAKPLGHWKNNKVVFVRFGEIIIYDVETRQQCRLEYPTDGRCANICAYEESLIPTLDRKEPRPKDLYAPKDWSVLHTDASFVSSFEPSGLAGCIRNDNGEWQLGFMERIYAPDSLMAELISILKGIIMCHNNGFSRIMVNSDCQSAVGLINQAHPPQAHDMYYNVVMKCKEWMLKMQKVKFRYSERCNNNLASAMARHCRENMGELNVTRTMPFPPKYILQQIKTIC